MVKHKIIPILLVSIFLLGSGAAFYYFVLPDFVITNLQVEPGKNYVHQPFKLTVEVKNTGLLKGEYTVEFFVNKELVGMDTVKIEGRETERASFIHTEPLAGEYVIQVGEHTITLAVFDEFVIKNHQPDKILYYAAVLQAEITDLGLKDELPVFFRWRAVGYPVWINTDKQVISEEQKFSQFIKYLKPETTYEFKAVAQRLEKETVSEILTFTTPEWRIAAFSSMIAEPEEYFPENVGKYARVKYRTPVFASLANVWTNKSFTSLAGTDWGVEWVNAHKSDWVGDEKFYYISWGWDTTGWVSAAALIFPEVSRLRGVDLQKHPDEHLAIVYASALTVRAEPGVMLEEVVVGRLEQYDVVSVQREQKINGAIWYKIAAGQWIHSDYVRDLIPGTMPEGVTSEEKWIEVNLSSQTIYAHQGDTPVYASLISSGRPGLETPPGLFRPWLKLSRTSMRGDRFGLAYRLADVPWVTFFKNDYAFHGTYWHNQFGTVRSSGCINLSIYDSLWFSRWSDPELLPGKREVRPTPDAPGTWVYVRY